MIDDKPKEKDEKKPRKEDPMGVAQERPSQMYRRKDSRPEKEKVEEMSMAAGVEGAPGKSNKMKRRGSK